MPSTPNQLVRATAKPLGRAPVPLLVAAGVLVLTQWWTLFVPEDADALSVFGVLWDIFVASAFLGGFQRLALVAVRGGQVGVGDTLFGFRTPVRWLRNVIAGAGIVVAVLAGLLLCILPGVYLGLRFAFVLLFVNERGLTPIDAFVESWRITAGHEIDILALAGVSVALFIAGLLCCGVGVIPATAVTAMAWGRLYDELRGEASEVPDPVWTPQP